MTRRFLRRTLPALAALGLLAAGCRGGYETETLRGEGVREWFLEADGARIEALAVWPAQAEGSLPALLLVHGDRGSAQSHRRDMFQLARQGFYGMSVSLPGFGQSTGPEDLGGPRSVKAILLAVDYLSKQSQVRPGGIAAFGEGLGAAPLMAAAAEDARVRAVAVEEPIYDLAEALPRLPEAQQRRLLRALDGPPGTRPAEYRRRSAREWAPKLQSPLLVIHDPQGRVTPLPQAEALVRAVREGGRAAQLQPARKQSIEFRSASLERWVVPFVRTHLPPEKPLRRVP
ncbi:MAG: hypothetical protein HYZ11_00860 [Candidatus Tectomicrobia bacterium]|uniref:Xaa-Pro dipeptidyl-peptidase-like domain-containing protein n=1 Tax=Tectimicrobiota bacterium TaxID=2528274 RepID=A0A932HXS9_UNCTE|nr:hypothetical protein [Candidatus Tectomicrobia bacterium]